MTNGSGCFQIYDKLETGRLLNSHVGGVRGSEQRDDLTSNNMAIDLNYARPKL